MIAIALAILALRRNGVDGLLMMWSGLSFLVASTAYFDSSPSLFGKSSRGLLLPNRQFLFLPYLLFAWTVWHAWRLLSREPAYHRITDRLLIGRRLLSHELPAGVDHVVDLTCEFNEPRRLREGSYRSLPILDGEDVQCETLRRWADDVARLPGTVYIHCAQGHGRTGMFAAAVLVCSGEAATPDEALNRITNVRPGVRLSPAQRQALGDAFATLYYTWDFSFQPISAIWRDLRRGWPRSCWFWFPLIMSRRLLRRRPYATYAVCRPAEFPEVPHDQLPRDARQAFDALDNACQSLGFEHVHTIRIPTIGWRNRFVSHWLERSGTISCSLQWTVHQWADFRDTSTTITCHSTTIDSRELHTIALDDRDWAPELVQPGHEYVRLPKDTDFSNVVARHRERIAGRSDLLVLDGESLKQKNLRDFQRLLEHCIAVFGHVRITDAEVEYLKLVPQPGPEESADEAK